VTFRTVCFAIVCLGVCVVARAEDADRSEIKIAVSAAADIPDSLLCRILAEAQAIWEPVGLAIAWHRTGTSPPPVDDDVHVIIERGDDRDARSEAPLGWIPFVNGAPLTCIHLSQTNAERLIRQTPAIDDATLQSHEVLVGRALGRAFAHELGHYVFGSKAHTRRGLMRATWPTGAFVSSDRRNFMLSSDERAAATRRLMDDRTRLDS
jgi:hypothetical protein